MEQSEVNFQLTKSFGYAFNGDQRQAEFITITPPTMRQHSQASALKQSMVKMVTAAVRDAVDTVSTDDNDDAVTSEMVVSAIYGSDSIDANVVWEQAKALFKEGVALVDGEQKLTAPMIDKMSPDDFEKLTGEYVANFTLV